ncbi:MAG TPA: hypothetical protein VF997_18095 [Polyangia bacterium]
MKIRPEDVDAAISDVIEAWREARQHCAAIGDDAVRPVAERIADALRDERLRDCLAPLFKGKGKKTKKK